ATTIMKFMFPRFSPSCHSSRSILATSFRQGMTISVFIWSSIISSPRHDRRDSGGHRVRGSSAAQCGKACHESPAVLGPRQPCGALGYGYGREELFVTLAIHGAKQVDQVVRMRSVERQAKTPPLQ